MKTRILLISLLGSQFAHAFPLPMNKILQSYDCQNCTNLSHETMTTAWLIKDQVYQHPGPSEQRSYSYRMQFTGKELAAGLAFKLNAPGALIQLHGKKNQPLPELKIKTANHQLLSLQEAAKLYSQGDQSLGLLQPTLLQLKPSLGSGEFQLITKDKSLIQNETYTLQVYEKYSTNYLSVSTDKAHYSYGDPIQATIHLTDSTANYPVENIRLNLISPDGNNISLNLSKAKHGEYIGETRLLSPSNTHGKNWVAQAELLSWYGHSTISRLTHVSFSYALPSASLYQINLVENEPMTYRLGVKVMTPSRYKLEGVLFKQDSDGHFHPLAIAQSSQWLETGNQSIHLSFKNLKDLPLNQERLFLGYFHLTDYGQMNTVYHYDKFVRLDRIE